MVNPEIQFFIWRQRFFGFQAKKTDRANFIQTRNKQSKNNAGAFYLARGKDAVIMFEIELENKSKIKVIGYNKIADKCYKELEKEDTIWIEGRIEAKQIVIKEFKAKHD